MKPARPTWPLALVCLTALTLPRTDLLSQRAAAQSTREKLEDRLLEGELLEVSSGDLDKAMTVYRALIDLADTPESVRARALLYLARCHRKLGQVDRAKEHLDRLVEKHAEERDVLRQARAFLRELQGEKVNPEFDWLGELGKSPEIQARVFDLAMDMVDLDGETGQRARRQLLALGSVGVPVLEKMVTTSRDARHRHHLALLLINMGKFEYWKVLLDPKSPLSTRLEGHMRNGRHTSSEALVSGLSDFFRSIPDLSDRDRARLLEVLGEIPEDEATEPYRQLILLRAGAVEKFAPAIPALEVLLRDGSSRLGIGSRFLERIRNDPAAPKAVAARMLDPACRTPDDYYRFLLELAPEALGVRHHELMLERLLTKVGQNKRRSTPTLERSHPLIARLEEISAFDELEAFATGLLAANLVDYFWKTHVANGRPSEAPAGWARILRRTRPVKLRCLLRSGRSNQAFELVSGSQVLHLMAEANDEFVDEFRDFLKNMDEEGPAFRGYGFRTVWPWLTSSWKPSDRYVEAMVDLLEGAPPFARVVALEALSLVAPLDDATLRRVEALASAAADDVVREYALYVLVRHFAARPEFGPRVARALMTEVLKRLDAGPGAAGATSLEDRKGFGSVTPRMGTSTGTTHRSIQLRKGYAGHPRWSVRVKGRDMPTELYPHVVDLTVDANGRRFHTWYVDACIDDRARARALLLAKAVEFEATERKVYAMPYLRGLDSTLHNEQTRFLKLIATDRRIETATRSAAVRRGGFVAVDWFDWPELFRTDDPLLEVLPHDMSPASTSSFLQVLFRFMEKQDASRQDAFWVAALESPHTPVRTRAYHSYPAERPDTVKVFERGLKDLELGVREQAKTRIAAARTNDMVPLLLVLLEDKNRQWRRNAIRALKNLALQESVEPLVKALDDPDYEVRSEALEALKAIRATLEEKREWKKLLEQIKKK